MRRRPPPNYLSRSVQRRLLMLVGMLLAVLVLMQEAGRPERWTWMWKITGQTPPTAASSPPSSIDSATSEAPGRTFQLAPERLSGLQDDTYFRPDETTAWFYVWSVLQNTSDAELAMSSLGHVSFLQIDQQIAAYRGKIVELRGTVRRAHVVDAPDNELGLDHYWQYWLFLDHGPTRPVVVYSLTNPDEFPDGMKIEAHVDLFGVVYKRWAYNSGEGLTVAPVVMTNHLRWLDPPEMPSTGQSTPQATLPWVIVVLFSALAVTWLLFRWTDRRRTTSITQNLPERIEIPPSKPDSEQSHDDHPA